MLTILLAVVAAQAAPQVVAVDHTATLLGDTITWESRVHLAEAGRERVVLPLAVPLESERELGVEADGTGLQVQEGVATALVVAPGRTVAVLLSSQSAPGGQADALRPPLLATEAIQRIDLDGLHWEPIADLGLERRMRHTVPVGMTPRERRAVDRRLDGRPIPKGSRVYVVADRSVVAARGLVGPVGPAGQVPLSVGLGVGAVFALAVGGGVLGYRLLDVQARRERLDAYIHDEFVRQELDGGPKRASTG